MRAERIVNRIFAFLLGLICVGAFIAAAFYGAAHQYFIMVVSGLMSIVCLTIKTEQ
jgi:hypothetical protein